MKPRWPRAHKVSATQAVASIGKTQAGEPYPLDSRNETRAASFRACPSSQVNFLFQRELADESFGALNSSSP